MGMWSYWILVCNNSEPLQFILEKKNKEKARICIQAFWQLKLRSFPGSNSASKQGFENTSRPKISEAMIWFTFCRRLSAQCADSAKMYQPSHFKKKLCT